MTIEKIPDSKPKCYKVDSSSELLVSMCPFAWLSCTRIKMSPVGDHQFDDNVIFKASFAIPCGTYQCVEIHQFSSSSSSLYLPALLEQIFAFATHTHTHTVNTMNTTRISSLAQPYDAWLCISGLPSKIPSTSSCTLTLESRPPGHTISSRWVSVRSQY